MGLFSFLNKNKQDTTGEDSGYFSRDEDSAATRARSKRASSANEPAASRGKKSRAADDPVLPEKKRARRRLVGAIALALAVAVGLPMLLDAEPKPLASDISIQIPSRDKAPPLPLPASSGTGAAALPSVSPADSLDRREEIVDAPKPQPTDVKPVSLDARAAVKNEPKPARAEPKPASPKPAPPKPGPKADDKPARAQPDSARATDILEGKAAEPAHEKYIVQVAALGSAEKVAELQGKLKAAGIHSFTHKVSTASGERIQVKLGPFSRDEADKMHARLEKAGLPGAMVRPDGK